MSNVRISGFRRVARRPQTSSLETVEDFSMYRAVRVEGIAPLDVESAVLNRIGEETILNAIDALPEDFRMVVVLADVEGFSYKEMAAILEVPIGTVTSRLFRGRKQLQRALWEHARDAGILASARKIEVGMSAAASNTAPDERHAPAPGGAAGRRRRAPGWPAPRPPRRHREHGPALDSRPGASTRAAGTSTRMVFPYLDRELAPRSAPRSSATSRPAQAARSISRSTVRSCGSCASAPHAR